MFKVSSSCPLFYEKPTADSLFFETPLTNACDKCAADQQLLTIGQKRSSRSEITKDKVAVSLLG